MFRAINCFPTPNAKYRSPHFGTSIHQQNPVEADPSSEVALLIGIQRGFKFPEKIKDTEISNSNLLERIQKADKIELIESNGKQNLFYAVTNYNRPDILQALLVKNLSGDLRDSRNLNPWAWAEPKKWGEGDQFDFSAESMQKFIQVLDLGIEEAKAGRLTLTDKKRGKSLQVALDKKEHLSTSQHIRKIERMAPDGSQAQKDIRNRRRLFKELEQLQVKGQDWRTSTLFKTLEARLDNENWQSEPEAAPSIPRKTSKRSSTLSKKRATSRTRESIESDYQPSSNSAFSMGNLAINSPSSALSITNPFQLTGQSSTPSIVPADSITSAQNLLQRKRQPSTTSTISSIHTDVSDDFKQDDIQVLSKAEKEFTDESYQRAVRKLREKLEQKAKLTSKDVKNMQQIIKKAETIEDFDPLRIDHLKAIREKAKKEIKAKQVRNKKTRL